MKKTTSWDDNNKSSSASRPPPYNTFYTPQPSAPNYDLEDQLPPPSAPPPPYDEVVYEWVYPEEVPLKRHASSEQTRATEDAVAFAAAPQGDAREAEKLRTWVSLCSFFCLVFNAGIFYFGETYYPHTLNKFFFSNLLTFLVFGLGASLFFRSAISGYRTGEAFFFCLFALVLVGTSLMIKYTIHMPERINHFCQMSDTNCPDDTSSMITAARVAGILGCLFWFVIFTAFARVSFVYLAAVLRLQGRPSSDLNPVIKGITRLLPNYHRIARCLLASCAFSICLPCRVCSFFISIISRITSQLCCCCCDVSFFIVSSLCKFLALIFGSVLVIIVFSVIIFGGHLTSAFLVYLVYMAAVAL